MRPVFTLFFALFTVVAALAQSAPDSLTNNILTTKVYRKGLYRTLQEFKTNSPSVTDIPILVVERDGNDRFWAGGTGYKLFVQGADGQKNKFLKGNYWGYCDGQNVYIRLQGDHVNVEKFETIGLYCYFLNHTIDPTAGILFGVVGGAIAASKSNEGTPYIMNFNSGVMAELTTRLAEQLLAKDPELQAQVGPVKQYPGDPKDFVSEYNYRHPDLIKPF